MKKVQNKTIAQGSRELYRPFEINASGLPYIKRTDSGGLIGDTIFKIVKKVTAQIQLDDATVTDFLYTIEHNIGGRYEVFGRYKRSTDTDQWIMIPTNEIVAGGGLFGGVMINNITEKDIIIWAWLGPGDNPKLDFELYFVNFTI